MKIGKKKSQIVDVHINSNSDALNAASLFKSVCLVDWSLWHASCSLKPLNATLELPVKAPGPSCSKAD